MAAGEKNTDKDVDTSSEDPPMAPTTFSISDDDDTEPQQSQLQHVKFTSSLPTIASSENPNHPHPKPLSLHGNPLEEKWFGSLDFESLETKLITDPSPAHKMFFWKPLDTQQDTPLPTPAGILERILTSLKAFFHLQSPTNYSPQTITHRSKRDLTLFLILLSTALASGLWLLLPLVNPITTNIWNQQTPLSFKFWLILHRTVYMTFPTAMAFAVHMLALRAHPPWHIAMCLSAAMSCGPALALFDGYAFWERWKQVKKRVDSGYNLLKKMKLIDMNQTLRSYRREMNWRIELHFLISILSIALHSVNIILLHYSWNSGRFLLKAESQIWNILMFHGLSFVFEIIELVLFKYFGTFICEATTNFGQLLSKDKRL
ncbi:hypothetical protein HDU97_008457, partial [Phlyctochytrium planicorne]